MKAVHTGPILNDDMRLQLNLSFSADEIKCALWSIPNDKAPSLDGYNSKFYKSTWPVIGDDIIKAIH